MPPMSVTMPTRTDCAAAEPAREAIRVTTRRNVPARTGIRLKTKPPLVYHGQGDACSHELFDPVQRVPSSGGFATGAQPGRRTLTGPRRDPAARLRPETDRAPTAPLRDGRDPDWTIWGE